MTERSAMTTPRPEPIVLTAPMQAEPFATDAERRRWTELQSRILVASVSGDALRRLQVALVQGWHMRVGVN